jgi:ATP-dependent DNA ligase
MKIRTEQYIWPPRPKTSIPIAEAQYLIDIGWIYQYKINDSRCLIKILPNGKIELWNRHAERFRTYTPTIELQEQLQELPKILNLDKEKLHIIDGGLIHQKHSAIKNTITIWDILVKNNTHLLGISYQERHKIITKGTKPYNHDGIPLGLELTPNIFHLTNNPEKTITNAWNTVHQINAPYTTSQKTSPLLEGIVLKDPQAPLEMGLKENNNGDWMCRSRIQTNRHKF